MQHRRGFLIFLMGMGLISAIGQADDLLNCTAMPGKQLVTDMRTLTSYLDDCSGASCYDLWKKQLRVMKDISDVYSAKVKSTTKVDRIFGNITQDAATKLCDYSWKGEKTWIDQLIPAANRTIAIYVQLQKAAGNPTPKTCTFK